MAMTRLFLDSTIIISAVTSRNPNASLLFIEEGNELYTNEYVVKEVRRILANAFDFPAEMVNKTIDFIEAKCIVLPMPNKNEFKKIEIKDKSDKPIVCSAMKKKCVLVTEDGLLYVEAKKYVITARPEEV